LFHVSVSCLSPLTACLLSIDSLVFRHLPKMPAMTPAEAASALLSKTKDGCPKPAMDENNAVAEKELVLDDFVMTQNGDDLIPSQGEKDAVVHKRRNPDRGAKIPQPTIPESQGEELKSPRKKGLDKSGKESSLKNAIAGKGVKEHEQVSSRTYVLNIKQESSF
jgi:hypothetical protein